MADPQSIAAWWRTNPQRHGQMLRRWLASEVWAEFWPAIKAGREFVR